MFAYHLWNTGYDVKDYGNIAQEERSEEETKKTQIDGRERFLRNPEDVAVFNGKVTKIWQTSVHEQSFNSTKCTTHSY